MGVCLILGKLTTIVLAFYTVVTNIVRFFPFAFLQEWKDYNVIWNKSEYGDIDSVRIHPRKLWTPDLLMYNR